MFDSVKHFIETTPNRNKHKALQFISPHITYSSLLHIGWTGAHHAVYKYSQAFYKKHSGICLESKKSTGRPSVVENPENISIVMNHCGHHEDHVHERLLVRPSRKAGHDIFAKRLTVSKRRLWHVFPHKNRIKRTSFNKIIKNQGQYKKSKKRTDLCELCEDAKQSKKILNEKVYNRINIHLHIRSIEISLDN